MLIRSLVWEYPCGICLLFSVYAMLIMYKQAINLRKCSITIFCFCWYASVRNSIGASLGKYYRLTVDLLNFLLHKLTWTLQIMRIILSRIRSKSTKHIVIRAVEDCWLISICRICRICRWEICNMYMWHHILKDISVKWLAELHLFSIYLGIALSKASLSWNTNCKEWIEGNINFKFTVHQRLGKIFISYAE